MITADQGMNYQQNLKARALAVIVLSTNKNSLVTENAMTINAAIDAAQPGGFTFVNIGY